MKTVATHNAMGHSFLESDPIQEMLHEYCAGGDKHVLEVGAGVGVNTLLALSAGNTVVTNDMEQGHLDIIAGEAEKMDGNKRNKLSFVKGIFPDQVNFGAAQFDVVIAFQIFHFLKPDQLDAGFTKIHDWLKPGGKFFLTVTSPFTRGMERYMPLYYRRLEKGRRFPGEFHDIRSRIPEKFRSQYPEYMNFLEEDTMRKTVPQDKFDIEEIMYFKAKSDSPLIKLDGKENLGVVLRKK